MKIFIITLVLVYLLICLLFYIFQRSFLYFPQPAGQVDATGISFDNKGQILTGWILNPGQQQALIYYGGNAGAIENNIDFLGKVATDYSIYLIPYRGYGNNQGKPTEKALYSDAVYIYDQVIKRHQSISLMGRSLGSGIATYVAANRQVEQLILSTPYDSIQNVAKEHYPFLPVSLLATDKFLSIERAAKISSKTLILIAEDDRVISRARSEALAKAFAGEILSKRLIKGAGHNDISLYPTYATEIEEFLKVRK